MTKEDAVMKVKWPRLLAAAAFIVTLVALGALEVLTARLPIDRDPSGAVSRENEVGAASRQSPLLSLEYATGSGDGLRIEARGGQLLR